MQRKAYSVLTLVALIVTACSGVLTEPLVGDWIIFSCNLPLGSLDVYKVRPDGTALTQIHSSDNNPDGYAGVAISADGTELIYIDNRVLTAMSLESGRKRRLVPSGGDGSDFMFEYSQETDSFVVYTTRNLAGDRSRPLFFYRDNKNPRLIRPITHYETPLGINLLTKTKLIGQTLDFVFVIDLESNQAQQITIDPRDYAGVRVGWVGMSNDEQYMLFAIQQPYHWDGNTEFSFSPRYRYDLYRQFLSTGEIEHIAQGIQPHVVSSPDGERIAYVQYSDNEKIYRLVIARPDGSDPTVVLSHPCMRVLEVWSST